MQQKKYKIKYAYSSRDDMCQMKKYILDQFKYRELGEDFTQKMKKATNGLKTIPNIHNTIGFTYRGYDIHENHILPIYSFSL